MSNVKVLGVGSPILDILVNIEEDFIDKIDGEKGGMELVSPEELEQILEMVETDPVLMPGGSAANTIFGLTALGLPTALLGKTGNDEQGEFYCSRYQKTGGDISVIKQHPTLPTGRCLSLITPDSERTMRTDLGAAATLAPAEISKNDLSGISHVHLEGYLLFNRELSLQVLKLAKECNCTVSLDMASFEVVKASMDILPEVLKDFIDIIFANEEEAAAYSGGKKPEDALEILSETCGVAVVKLGKDGALVKDSESSVKVDGKVVEAVDTTGAGDLWASGFLYKYLSGSSIKEAAEAGNEVASEVVQIMGASIPEEKWRNIKRKIN
jgi:sugar/nucleoside kinase (ribokinase family)